jgi:zinc transporter 1/2/3
MFDPSNIDLTSPEFSLRDAICFLNAETDSYDGNLGARIFSIFVIFAVPTAVTLLPGAWGV